jgi:hypothetical protein
MAGLIVGFVLDRYPPDADLGEFLAAIVLADSADHDGSNVRPSVPRIATLSRQSQRSVQYHLRDMQLRGFLVLVRQGGGRNRPTEYRINLDWLETQVSRCPRNIGAPPAPIPERVHEGHLDPAVSVSERCTNGATQIAPNPQPLTHDPSDPSHLRPEIGSSRGSGGNRQKLQDGIEQAIADELQGRIEAASRHEGPPIHYPKKWTAELRRRATEGEDIESEYGKAIRRRREAETRYQQALTVC